MGSHHKRERDKNIKVLTECIKQLETLHKQSLTAHTVAELLETRKAFQQLFDIRSKRYLFFIKGIYYESGNKTCNLLARVLKEQTANNFIHGIQRSDGTLDMTTEAIEKHFQNFYTKLYNLPPNTDRRT